MAESKQLYKGGGKRPEKRVFENDFGECIMRPIVLVFSIYFLFELDEKCDFSG